MFDLRVLMGIEGNGRGGYGGYGVYVRLEKGRLGL